MYHPDRSHHIIVSFHNTPLCLQLPHIGLAKSRWNYPLPGVVIDPQPHFTNNADQKTICIIGAGPAGLAALQTVLDSEQYKSGKWLPVTFESRDDIGGIWLPAPPDSADPPLTPLYDCLTTNLPHPSMAYSSYSFPPETPLFPIADKVLDYLRDYTSHFSLRNHIKFNTSVTSVTYTPTQQRPWLVQTSPNDEAYQFDLIMICNGHYRIPRYPSVPGLSEWRNAHKASHAVSYRHPLPIYKDKTLLIVGSGPSGHDLFSDLQGHASRIIISGSDLGNPPEAKDVPTRPRVISFSSDPSIGKVTFSDGSSESGIDYCILATGYCQSFPFLQLPIMQPGYPPEIPPLPKSMFNSSYSIFPLARQLWPLQSIFPPESMAFLGIPVRVAPFPLVEAQARAALRAFDTFTKSGKGIDEQAAAVDVVTRWESLKSKFDGNTESIIKYWHQFEALDQFDYRDVLSVFAEMEPSPLQLNPGSGKTWSQELLDNPPDPKTLPPSQLRSQNDEQPKQVIRVQDWEKEMYLKKDILRRTWVRIEKSGDAEKWLKGVGKNGVEDWVDLMRRIVKYGEELETEEGKARL